MELQGSESEAPRVDDLPPGGAHGYGADRQPRSTQPLLLERPFAATGAERLPWILPAQKVCRSSLPSSSNGATVACAKLLMMAAAATGHHIQRLRRITPPYTCGRPVSLSQHVKGAVLLQHPAHNGLNRHKTLLEISGFHFGRLRDLTRLEERRDGPQDESRRLARASRERRGLKGRLEGGIRPSRWRVGDVLQASAFEPPEPRVYALK